jgi:hypothetical protein
LTLFALQKFPRALADILLEFVPLRDQVSLTLVSRSWRLVVKDFNTRRKALLSQMIRGFEKVMKSYLDINFSQLAIAYSKCYEAVHFATLFDHRETFALRELQVIANLWEAYLRIRTLEYPFVRDVYQKIWSFLASKISPEVTQIVPKDELSRVIAIPFLKALVHERLAKTPKKLSAQKVEDIEKDIVSNFASQIAMILQKDPQLIFQDQLKKVIQLMVSPTGAKISLVESKWNLDVCKASQQVYKQP